VRPHVKKFRKKEGVLGHELPSKIGFHVGGKELNSRRAGEETSPPKGPSKNGEK